MSKKGSGTGVTKSKGNNLKGEEGPEVLDDDGKLVKPQKPSKETFKYYKEHAVHLGNREYGPSLQQGY